MGEIPAKILGKGNIMTGILEASCMSEAYQVRNSESNCKCGPEG
jgi:hypothetical protein